MLIKIVFTIKDDAADTSADDEQHGKFCNTVSEDWVNNYFK